MKALTIFVNELSLNGDRDLSAEELLPHLLATLRTARLTKKLRPDLSIAGGLVGLPFGNGLHTFASVLRGADYREEWRFLKSLEQASPWDPSELMPTTDLGEVRFQDQAAQGMLWAMLSNSAVLSFALANCWEASFITAKHSVIDLLKVVTADVEVANLAKPDHVAVHENLIREYGFNLSSSSIIYECEDFTLRMYFNDHNPPHFHLMAPEDASKTIACFAIGTLDQLAQSEPVRPALRRSVTDWAQVRKMALMNCWQDCRRHRHPARLD